MSICIIGAGTAGLCAARYAIQNHFKLCVFEQTGSIGGTWVYTDEIDSDTNRVHSSMYQGLRTNLPKEIMGYPDFPFPECEESYLPAAKVQSFLQLFVDKYDLNRHIRFFHCVDRVRYRNDKWEVMVTNLQTQIVEVRSFDYIMLCNGHYNTPRYPKVPGMEQFRGRIVHSHNFRTVKDFLDHSVLVIGAGPSGMDLCNELSKVTKKVLISHRLDIRLGTTFTTNVILKYDVLRIDKNGAHFADGTYEELSTILLCTGYMYSFPFLEIDCGVTVNENYVEPLYKHIINIHNPSMAFIGLPFYVCAAQMVDLQIRFVMEFFTGRKVFPSNQEMLEDTKTESNERVASGYTKRQAHLMGPRQMAYYNDLAAIAGVDTIKPVMSYLHNESSRRFLDDLRHFREDIFHIIDDEHFVRIN